MKLSNIAKTLIILLIFYSIFHFFYIKRNNTGSRLGLKPINVSDVLSDNNRAGVYKKAVEKRNFKFPADHGPHNNYQTEWWYFTGNVKDQSNKKFGYQLTFFRRGLDKSTKSTDDSGWRTHNIYFAHLALSDMYNRKYYSFEKWSRGMDELAGAVSEPLRVWMDNWSLKIESGKFIIKASSNDFSIELQLEALKNIILQGDNGLSKKSSDSGNASYYYSITRLKTSGIIEQGDKSYKVQGASWFDHEWSTSALSSNQEGWDWFSIQLDNNIEIMIYILRLKNGQTDPVSSGTIVYKDGNVKKLKYSDFKINQLDSWKSNITGIKYPSGWKIDIPGSDISLIVEPQIPEQEFNHSVTYWEGAVTVRSAEGIKGAGYVELTGYN